MKILLIHNSYQTFGGEDVVFQHERLLLERKGHRVLTYCRSNFEADAYSGLRRPALVRNIVWSDKTRDHLAKLLQEEKPDVVHVHNTFMMMSPAVFATCRAASIPVVQTLHNFRLFCLSANFHREGRVCEECREHSMWRGIQYGCFRDSRLATASVALMLTVQRQRHAFPDAFIALSEFSRQKFIAGGIPPEKIFVKPNFVDPDPGVRASDGGYAVFAGRLSAEKGLHTVLAAWKQLNRKIPLSIIGDGPQTGELKQKAADLNLDMVRFHGRLPHSETAAAIKSSRFLIAPSECYENFPMGIVEAFACGVPVLGARLGSTEEMIRHRHTGLLFPPSQPAELAAAAEWAWNHPKEMWEMGRNARREFEARFTAEKNYPQLMDIYQSVASAEKAVGGALLGPNSPDEQRNLTNAIPTANTPGF